MKENKGRIFIIYINPWHQEPEIHYTILGEKIDNKEIHIFFAFSPDFPLPIPIPPFWKFLTKGRTDKLSHDCFLLPP